MSCLRIFFYFLMIAPKPIVSESTGPIFMFLPNDRYLFIDDRSEPFFPIPQGTLPWQLIICKSGETDCNIAIRILKYTMSIFS